MLRPLAIVNYVQGPDLTRSETVEVHAGVFHEDEEVLEEELYTLGFRRNPIACFKSLPDDRPSEGFWSIRAGDDPLERIEPGMQVHDTMFERDDGEPGLNCTPITRTTGGSLLGTTRRKRTSRRLRASSTRKN